ncbi:MAG: hypothetical protein DLM55_08165 [Acidimicrobiales bacterium]|nr:MAG: hypothetical protein DLM55_08165 [Acidimicrobiales bacterium]
MTSSTAPREQTYATYFGAPCLRGGELWCAAVTIAEVARGISRTRDIETALARQHGGYRIRVLDTDQTVAKLVGAILYTTHSPIHRLADAHVLATCAPAELAVVITSDSDDITELSAALPGTAWWCVVRSFDSHIRAVWPNCLKGAGKRLQFPELSQEHTL